MYNVIYWCDYIEGWKLHSSYSILSNATHICSILRQDQNTRSYIETNRY